ncbi:MAG: acyl-CoA dehydrogenase family protein [Thermodesulfobacteriota bacterium]|nr:acyl-CoA dehydrogenase family protein [Thermodesulfobacteriota bacterium]
MFDYLLSDEQKKLKQEARDFVKSIPRKMILDMDADKIQFPKEFLQEAGRRNLMGCRGGGAARMMFKDVKVPRENLLGELNQGVKVFNTMMIPKRLGTAAMTIGAAVPAVDVATGYTSKRRAFGQPVANFQGVSFQVAEAVTLLDAARSVIYTTARAVSGTWSLMRLRPKPGTKKFLNDLICRCFMSNTGILA